MKPEEVVAAYGALLERAGEIVFICNKHYARLEIEDEWSIVHSPSAEAPYDSPTIEDVRSEYFPTKLLSASESELASWLEERKLREKAERDEEIKKSIAEAQRKEREWYESLKKKYEVDAK